MVDIRESINTSCCVWHACINQEMMAMLAMMAMKRGCSRCRRGEDDHGDHEAMVAVMTVLALRAIPASPQSGVFLSLYGLGAPSSAGPPPAPVCW